MSEATRAEEGKYLTFALSGEEYGLEILKVREIFGILPITQVPHVPRDVKGVINLRGQVISVVDLRLKFNMESTEQTDETCIIVVEIAKGERSTNIGIIVDKVEEVLDIAAANIEDAPAFGGVVNTEFILGLAKVEDSVKILLDIDKVLAPDESAAISASSDMGGA